ncbi:NAD(P)-binding domain-containing protein, partial [Candidatus Entotheonella palauensis]|uniref:NAD(P)-binding domain-containing protein n=1 Tax=Candidatus Entotheonella palauensis TaxID=93172 RepID=UPI001C4DF2A7
FAPGSARSLTGKMGTRPFKNTRVTSSKHFLHASDFPMPEGISDFPHHTQILSYLQSYIDHFGLRERFQLNTRVVHLGKDGAAWRVVTETATGGRQETMFDAVVVSSGPHQTPRLQVSQDPLYGRYQGKLLHAADYKEGVDVEPGETVLVVGTGESAADIVDEYVNAGAKLYWVSRRGQWFADRNIGPYPADHFTSFGVRALAGRFMNMEYLIRRFVIAEFINLAWGRGGHGIAAWVPDAPYLHQFVNKSRDGVLDVYSGKVTPKNAPVGIEGKFVYFNEDEPPIEVDRIVLATGYDAQWPFLDHPPSALFKRVFHPEDLTLAFVGFARPILGSIPSLSELQSRWLAHVWAGQVTVPSRARRAVALLWDRRAHRRSITDSSRLGVLVDHEVYATELASFVKAQVHWLKLLLRHPGALMMVLISPWIAFKYHLNDPDPAKRQAALQNIRRELPEIRNPVYRLVLYVALFLVLVVVTIALGLWYLPIKVVAILAAAFILVVVCILRLTERAPTQSQAISGAGQGMEPDMPELSMSKSM